MCGHACAQTNTHTHIHAPSTLAHTHTHNNPCPFDSQALKARVTLPDELHQLMLHVHGMSPAARARALSALQVSMRARWHEIFVHQANGAAQPQQAPYGNADESWGLGGSAAAGGFGRQVRPDVVRVAWRLATIATEIMAQGSAQQHWQQHLHLHQQQQHTGGAVCIQLCATGLLAATLGDISNLFSYFLRSASTRPQCPYLVNAYL